MRFLFHGRTDTEWDPLEGFGRYVVCLWDGEICIKNKKTDRKVNGHPTKNDEIAFNLVNNQNKKQKITDREIYEQQFRGRPMKPLTYLL